MTIYDKLARCNSPYDLEAALADNGFTLVPSDIPSIMEEVKSVLTKLIGQRDGHYGIASEWDEARALLAKLEGK